MSADQIAWLLVTVGAVLALAGAGLWMVRTRRRAWEEYERRRDAGGRAGVEPTRPW